MLRDWRISILVVQTTRCSLSESLLYQLAVGLFDRGHLCLRNFTFFIPIDVVRLTVRVHAFGLEFGVGEGEALLSEEREELYLLRGRGEGLTCVDLHSKIWTSVPIIIKRELF